MVNKQWLQHVLSVVCVLGTAFATPSLHAEEATPKGKISARGCESMAVKHSDDDAVLFTANFGSDQYKVGDGLQLFITAKEDAYVTIIDQGSDPKKQRKHVLFTDKALEAGKEAVFPPVGYKLAVKPALGSNRFDLLLSRRPNSGKELTEHTGANSKDVDLEKIAAPEDDVTHCQMSFEIVKG